MKAPRAAVSREKKKEKRGETLVDSVEKRIKVWIWRLRRKIAQALNLPHETWDRSCHLEIEPSGNSHLISLNLIVFLCKLSVK